MPFKSQKQKEKFLDMLSKGEISKSTFDEWNSDTPDHLPERIKDGKPKPFTNEVRKVKVIK